MLVHAHALQAGVTSSNADAVELQSFNSFADIEASASTTRVSLLSTMARLQDELSTVAATLSELQSGQPAGTCQGYTLANGTAYGAGLGHGATRVLQVPQSNNGSLRTARATHHYLARGPLLVLDVGLF